MKNKFLFYLIIVVVSIILIIFAINVFPVPGTDSRVFIPPAVMYAKGYGFVNPLYDITFIKGLYKDPASYFQFNYYVPFYSLILGTISKIAPGIKTIFFICSIFSTINLMLYGWMTISPVTQNRNFWLRALLFLSIIYIATFILPTVGRPENLSCLIIFIIYILYVKQNLIKNKLIYNVSLCVLFSLLLSTQIIGFYFCALFFLTFELLNATSLKRTILINITRFTLAIIGFLIILALSPNGLTNTLNGIKLHGSWAMTRVDRSIKMFLYYWILAPLNFGFLGIIICAGLFYISSIISRLKEIRGVQLLILVLLQLVILVSIPKFILYASPTVYNATQFIFPVSVYIFSQIPLITSRFFERLCSIVILICYVGGFFIFARWVALFAEYKISGKDYDHARMVMANQLLINKNAKITVALWSLCNAPYTAGLFDGTYKKGDIVIIQQIFAHDQDYLQYSKIKYDWRTKMQFKILGTPLSKTPQSYGFIVCQFNANDH